MSAQSATKDSDTNGIGADAVNRQLQLFKQGFPFAQLVRAAVPGDGILQISSVDIDRLTKHFDAASGKKKLLKFVPASGAATRMFKSLIDVLNGSEPDDSVVEFMDRLADFAFFPKLQSMLENEQVEDILSGLLTGHGLNYQECPKGLITFHHYENGARTSFEEHLEEAAHYSSDENGIARLHFTVSEQHLAAFNGVLEAVKESLEKQFDRRLEVEFSIQKPATDTVAVDLENKPVKKENGALLMRPAGHGALLENLNDLEADVVFIKNIDNVNPAYRNAETIQYKKALGGYLLELQSLVFEFLIGLDENNLLRWDEIKHLAKTAWNIDLETIKEDTNQLKTLFNKPIRVCGMVKNEGKAGGGPFWVKRENGQVDLQIIEAAQVDTSNSEQLTILQQATHFNPVDLVCGIKNYKGEKFYLPNFRDDAMFFVTQKSWQGQEIKALELPGLWNGGMADWLTVFVEVPLATFNPVKTVNDLLNEGHQPI